MSVTDSDIWKPMRWTGPDPATRRKVTGSSLSSSTSGWPKVKPRELWSHLPKVRLKMGEEMSRPSMSFVTTCAEEKGWDRKRRVVVGKSGAMTEVKCRWGKRQVKEIDSKNRIRAETYLYKYTSYASLTSTTLRSLVFASLPRRQRWTQRLWRCWLASSSGSWQNRWHVYVWLCVPFITYTDFVITDETKRGSYPPPQINV